MNNHTRFYPLYVALLFATTAATAAENDLALTVKASGASPGKGQAVFTLFSTKESFLKEPLATRSLPIGPTGQAVLQLDKLKPGTYALSVYYDQDSNGKLNTGLFGIPSELVGFSNNAKGLFGPPSFRKAAFSITEDRTIEIKLGKAKD